MLYCFVLLFIVFIGGGIDGEAGDVGGLGEGMLDEAQHTELQCTNGSIRKSHYSDSRSRSH